jgi:hypothetical protein
LEWFNVPTDRHNGGGNFSFAEGQCARWKWRQVPKDLTKFREARGATDLADLTRLRAAIPDPLKFTSILCNGRVTLP